MKHHVILLSAMLSLAACTVSAPVVSPDDETNTIEPDSYIGLSVADAEAKADAEGVPFRVVEEDGVSLPVTMDYRPGRINARVENGIVTGYDVEGEESSVPPVTYDQDSWKTMIPDSCLSFFDGCNNCNRQSAGSDAACTKMFCEQYQQPVCLDE